MNSPCAVIDIGSNTLLLTVARSTATGYEILVEEAEVTRLGQNLSDGRPLYEPARQRALATLKRFCALARAQGCRRIVAAGTAAFRRARDGAEFAQKIEQDLGISVRILSGEEEARYSFASARYDFGHRFASLGMIDIGGGSTELVFGETGPRLSLPLGTVRLAEQFPSAHPIPDPVWNALRHEIRRELQSGLPLRPRLPQAWVAVAATPSSLAALVLELEFYDTHKIHGYALQKENLQNLVEKTRNMSLEERLGMPGMHPQRAELLPIGGLILEEVASFVTASEIWVSDHGLRYGLLQEILSQSSILTLALCKSSEH